MELFVYGTLLFPEIRNKLLNKDVLFKTAYLKDFVALVIQYDHKNSEYPVLQKKPGTTIKGVLLYELNDEDMSILEYYEGDEYTLKQVDILIENSYKEVLCFMPDEKKIRRLGQEWDYLFFKEQYLEEYLNNIIPGILKEYHGK